MEDFLIFVYGTLKKGFNNNYLLNNSKFIGEAITIEKYALYQSGIPFVIKDKSVSKIHGEVYSVDSETLNILDDLEGHPNCYKREEIFVSLRQNNEKIKAWIYFYPKAIGELVPTGVYEIQSNSQ